MSAATLLKVFGEMAPAELTSADVWEFMQARGKTSKVRANRERSLLQSVMRYAIVWGHLRDNVVREVPPFKEMPRDRYVTDEEFQAVKAIASPVVAAVMELARLTGQRRGDLITLRRDAITDDGLMVSQTICRVARMERHASAVASEIARMNPPRRMRSSDTTAGVAMPAAQRCSSVGYAGYASSVSLIRLKLDGETQRPRQAA